MAYLPHTQRGISYRISPFVGRNGTLFTRNGDQWRGMGVNLANGAGGINNCGPVWTDADKAEQFCQIAEVAKCNVVRVSWYQPYAPTGADGVTNFAALDRCVQLAKQYNLLLFPTFEDHWGHCFGNTRRTPQWYDGGYNQPYDGNRLGYKEYVRRVVERYRNEPCIFAWGLMNEVEGRNADGSYNWSPLLRFAADMSAFAKSIDPNHLLTLGLHNVDEPDSSSVFHQVHELPHIDFGEYHDYARNDEAWPGADIRRRVPVTTCAFAQDWQWGWLSVAHAQGYGRRWEERSHALPATARMPMHRCGLRFEGFGGAYVGDIYIDTIVATRPDGSVIKTWDVANGSTANLLFGDRIAGVTNVQAPPQLGINKRVLKVTLPPATAGKPTDGWMLLPDSTPKLVPGATVRFGLWHDLPGDTHTQTSLAARMETMRAIGKPLVIGESGMWLSPPKPSGETRDSRARKMDAKIGAAFGNGVGAIMVSLWERPADGDEHAILVGDPLVDVLARYGTLV